MVIQSRDIAVGMNLDKVIKEIVCTNGECSVEINISNGKGIYTEKRNKNHSCDLGHDIKVDSIAVIISGGDLNNTEYKVRSMTPLEIYEVIKKGYTVTASGYEDWKCRV